MIAKATHDTLWDWNLRTNEVWWNENFQTMFGYSPNEIEPDATSWTSRIHPDDEKRVLTTIHDVIDNGGENWQAEYRFRRADGSYAIVFDRGYTLHDGDGAYRMVGSMQDITERKNAEGRLKENEERFRMAVESTKLGTWDFDLQTGILKWDNRTKELFGIYREGFVDYSIFLQGLHTDDRERVDTIIQNVFKPGSDGYYDTEYRTVGLEDGKLRWVAAKGRAFFDEEGNVYRFIGTVLDITDKKSAEEEIKLQARVLESMDEGVSVSDEKGYILYTNAAEDRMFGYAPGELIGQHISVQNAYTPEENTRIEASVIAELQARDHWNGEWHNRRKDGSDFYTYSHITSLNLGERRVLVCVQRDITEEKKTKEALQRSAGELERRVLERTKELKEANEQLARSNAELEQFAYITSHDLQEPLRKIRTFASRMEDELRELGNETVLKHLGKVMTSAERMSSLIRDLLNYSRLTREDKGYEEVSLNEIVQDVLSDLELLVSQKNATVYTESLPDVNGIRLQLNQLFYNLIGNSLKFSKPGEPPLIQITARELSPAEAYSVGLKPVRFHQITFKDNGIGFNSKYSEQIFEIFQRLNSRDVFAGTGIGLALSKKVVENHQGRISAFGEEGKGATFIVYLPAE